MTKYRYANNIRHFPTALQITLPTSEALAKMLRVMWLGIAHPDSVVFVGNVGGMQQPDAEMSVAKVKIRNDRARTRLHGNGYTKQQTGIAKFAGKKRAESHSFCYLL